ncbi:MAG: D-alanine--D-alanine ligase [Candidatus Eutrophobiaceae bacterium]
MNAKDCGKIAVLMGGDSAEREISLESGQAVLEALGRNGVDAQGVDLRYGDLRALCELDIQGAFIALHGRGGEDGSLQGVLEWMGLPYTGSGVMASALAMDKHLSKLVWREQGLPVAEWELLEEDTDWQALADRLELPLMIKPAREGSSIGMSKVGTVAELPGAWREAARCDGKVLAERWIEGSEYTVAMLNERALPSVRLEYSGEFYDYHSKYEAVDTRYHCPSGLTDELERELGELALSACASLGVRAWGRVDLMLDSQNRPCLIEINTVPGMTSHSLVPKAAREAGMDFDALVMDILELSFQESGA